MESLVSAARQAQKRQQAQTDQTGLGLVAADPSIDTAHNSVTLVNDQISGRQEKPEQKRLERERQEQERLEQERLEKEKHEKREQKKCEPKNREQERLEREKLQGVFEQKLRE